MRYVQINSVPNGSTGTVMKRVEREQLSAGDECWRMWGRGRAAENDHEVNFGSKVEFYVDVLQTRLDDCAGFHSEAATRRLLAKLEEIDPGIVHLHNLHGYYVNVEILFDWLARHRCQVRWTLHDCWAFTGHCAHFLYIGCDRWRNGCHDCPQKHDYPASYILDSSARNYERKRVAFTSIAPERMNLITPSRWLEGLVRGSFLGCYPVEVRRNTVDTTVFKPTSSDFRERYGVGDRFMVLGVASSWTARKGLSDFIKLTRELDQGRFAVVLVGLSKRQLKRLPDGIIGIGRTSSQRELAEVYSTADILFNPTREDTFPTVNLEAEACGTPVVTYDTGGCKETLMSKSLNSIVVDGFDGAAVLIRAMCSGRGGGAPKT